MAAAWVARYDVTATARGETRRDGTAARREAQLNGTASGEALRVGTAMGDCEGGGAARWDGEGGYTARTRDGETRGAAQARHVDDVRLQKFP